MKKKIDIIVLGGSGLIGKEIIKKFIKKKNTILNIDIKKLNIKNKYYLYSRIDITSNTIESDIKNLLKVYGTPNVYIDTSYISREIFKYSSFEKIKKNNLDKILINWLSSSIIISTIILNKMKSNKIKGSLILTSSVYSKVAQDPAVYKGTDIKENIAYSIVKASIDNFVKSAATQFGGYGIRVNSVVPGGIRNKNDPNFSKNIFLKNYLKKVAIKRFATAKEIANIYEFLASDHSSYVTGINLVADGGYTIV